MKRKSLLYVSLSHKKVPNVGMFFILQELDPESVFSSHRVIDKNDYLEYEKKLKLEFENWVKEGHETEVSI